MRDRIDPYSLCFCGSGKKYRFCCQRKKGAPDTQSSSKQPASVFIGDMEEAERLHAKGLKYMHGGKFEEAIQWFKKSMAASEAFFGAANNLALCLFLTGKCSEAIQVQSQSLQDSPFPNPFGLASLAMFFLAFGEDDKAEKAASFAAELKAPNEDATIKVCETLARLRRHRDIIATADASDFADDPSVRFFTGVAAANLGNYRRAIEDLSCVPAGHSKAQMTQQYLQHLKNKTQPNTIRKDWPYLLPEEFYASSLIKHTTDAEREEMMSRRYVVDFAEAVLNDKPEEAADSAMQILAFSKHPEATALLWLIMKGSFGNDQLRLHAASILTEKDEIKPGEEVEFLCEGESSKKLLFSISLNPEFIFCEVPQSIEKRYENLILAGRKPYADWSKITLGYKALSHEVPHFYPARYNYAIGLVRCKRTDEAEPILRSLVADYPEYLFARATLLHILVRANRLDEAGRLVATTEFPSETHPDAYVAWLANMADYHEAIGENEEVYKTLLTAREINPLNSHVKALWKRWKDYNVEKDTSAYLKLKRMYKKTLSRFLP